MQAREERQAELKPAENRQATASGWGVWSRVLKGNKAVIALLHDGKQFSNPFYPFFPPGVRGSLSYPAQSALEEGLLLCHVHLA